MNRGIVTAGMDGRGLRVDVPFLERGGGLLHEAPSAEDVLALVSRDLVDLVVIGPRLPDLTLAQAVRRIRGEPAGRRVSVLAVVPEAEPPEVEGEALDAGADAVVRRPLDRFVLESWVARLVGVTRRVLVRSPVHVQVVGRRNAVPGEHFYGLSRNLSLRGMLLASPVRIARGDVDLDLDLPEPEGRVAVLGRIAREAPEVGWPYLGYGIEFVFVSEAGRRAIERLVRRESPPEPSRILWAPAAIHSTLRRDEWIYEITEPARTEGGLLVEIRRAAREAWRPGRAGPFHVVWGDSPQSALVAARAFVRRHG